MKPEKAIDLLRLPALIEDGRKHPEKAKLIQEAAKA